VETGSGERAQEGGAPRRSRGVRRGDWLALGALVSLHVGFFREALLLRGFLVHGDICYQFEPLKALLHESLRAGRLPLWSPYLMMGYPIAAEGQIGAFYPVALLISWVLPSPGAINYIVAFHLLLAGIGMFLLARRLGVSAFGAWLAAVVFSFSGYFFAHIHHISLICAAAWVPLTLLFVERAWQADPIRNGVLAALALAACALSGHPQTLFFSLLIVIFWTVWRALARSREVEAPRRAVTILAAVFGLGLGIAAVQLLLTADLSIAAPHSGASGLAYVTAFSLVPKHLFGLVSPNWEGTPAFDTYVGLRYYWEYVLYIGLVPLGLAAVGGARRRGWALAGLAVCALALALARGNPLYQVLQFIPGFSYFRVPARYIFVFTFAASLLAAYGWETIAGWRWLRRSRLLLVVGAAVAALTVADLISFDRTLAPLATERVYTSTSPAARILSADDDWHRSFIIPPSTVRADWVPKGGLATSPDGWEQARALLPADVPQSYRIRQLTGYIGFTPPEWDIFFQSAYVLAAYDRNASLLSLIGTRYLAVPPHLEFPQLSGRPAGDFTIYHNPDAFPRAFAVGEALFADDRVQAHLRTVELARAGGLRGTAVVEGWLGDFRPSGGAAALSVEEVRPERVRVRAQSRGDVLLVLNERWDPGWRVEVDGRRSPLVIVDTILMGTALPAGEHTVEFYYRPRALVVGRAVSLLALMAAAFLLLPPRTLSRLLAKAGARAAASAEG